MKFSRRTLRRSAKQCLSYWSEGIVYCTCGHLLKETVANRRFIEYTLDLLSIPEYVIKKGRLHGHKCGKLSENKEYHLAHNLKKRCKKRDYKGIHDRFLRDHVFRERMIQNNRDEEVCRVWAVLAEQDHTYWMSESEYIHYRQNWWISLNKSGNDTQPVRKRSDFNQALSTLKPSHREAGGRHRALLEVQTMEIVVEFFPPPGGNGANLGGFPKNSKKVKKEEASKGLRSNGATRCLQNFGENLRQVVFKNSFCFVTDRSFTADGGLL